jgi:iron-sulfur cluster repair protein YtfE (RIC family)
MKATDLLTQQHRKVISALEKILSSNGGRAALLEVAGDLAAHMAIEQELFYPAVHAIDPDLVMESYEEHAVAEIELKRALAASEDEGLVVKVHVLKGLLEHHIEEEEQELFPAVRESLPAGALEELGARMEKQFADMRAAGFAQAVPAGFARTSSDDDKHALFGHHDGRASRPILQNMAK